MFIGDRDELVAGWHDEVSARLVVEVDDMRFDCSLVLFVVGCRKLGRKTRILGLPWIAFVSRGKSVWTRPARMIVTTLNCFDEAIWISKATSSGDVFLPSKYAADSTAVSSGRVGGRNAGNEIMRRTAVQSRLGQPDLADWQKIHNGFSIDRYLEIKWCKWHEETIHSSTNSQ